MKLVIDTNGNAGFDNWFNEDDVDKIITALKSIGIDVKKEEVDYEFKPVPILKKKERYEPIATNPRNVFLILSNADKDNDEILEILGIERESGFIITTLLRKLQGEYVKWQKIDYDKKWVDDEEKMKAFAKFYASQQRTTNKRIIKNIEKMEKDGCRQLEEASSERFPECESKFNKNCITCQFGNRYIKDEGDIERYNQVLAEEFD